MSSGMCLGAELTAFAEFCQARSEAGALVRGSINNFVDHREACEVCEGTLTSVVRVIPTHPYVPADGLGDGGHGKPTAVKQHGGGNSPLRAWQNSAPKHAR